MSAAADVRPALMGHLKDLRLPTVRECYEETAQQAEREALSYEQYLLEVISRECDQRRKSKVQRLLKDSALPLEKSLQNFNLKRLPAKAARQLRTLQEGSFLDRKENVLVFGNPGSGKSHLLTALAQELVVTRERKMHFTKCALLMQDLLAAKRDFHAVGGAERSPPPKDGAIPTRGSGPTTSISSRDSPLEQRRTSGGPCCEMNRSIFAGAEADSSPPDDAHP